MGKRFARGSSTGEHQIQHDTVQLINAHSRVQTAAQVVAELAVGTGGRPIVIDEDDDSMISTIERAQRVMQTR